MFKLIITILLYSFVGTGVAKANHCQEVYRDFSRSFGKTYKTQAMSEHWTLARKVRSSGELVVESHYNTQTLFSGRAEPSYSGHPMFQYADRGMGSSHQWQTSNLVAKTTRTKPMEPDSLLDQVYDKTTRLTDFLGKHYPRRKWDHQFTTEKAANGEALNGLFPQTYRAEVLSPLGEVIGSGVVIYSPFLIVKNTHSGKRQMLPWMEGRTLLAKLEGNDFSNVGTNNYKLPVESFFGVEVLRNRGLETATVKNNKGEEFTIELGMIAEIGSFAINNKSPFRQQVLEELYYEFLIASYHTPFQFHASAPLVNLAGLSQSRAFQNQALFFTYGDRVGQRLYSSKPFDFQPVEGVTRDHYDVEWAPLIQGAQFLENFAQKKEFSDVAARAFDDLVTSGVPIDAPQFRYPMMRSMSQDMMDLYKASQFQQDFVAHSQKELLPIFAQFSEVGRSTNPNSH